METSKNAILHSKIIGEGVPLLILHGYFGMSDNWKTLGAKFAETYQVHLIDQRNHGRSFHADAFNYDVLVADLLYYIEHHNLENVHLIGHSMGGKTVMFFAISHPELVSKLAVADIGPKAYKLDHNEILAGLNAVDFSVENTRKLVDEKLAKFIPEMGIRQFLLKSVYWKEKGILGFRFNLDALTAKNSEIGASLPLNTVFENNTLFLKGEKSGYITENDVINIEKHFPNSKIVTISNAGHWLHAENPTEFYEAIVQFLG